MSEFDSLSPAERAVFLDFTCAAQKASEALEAMHAHGETLCNKFGWDLAVWDLAKAAMLVEHQTRGNWRMFLERPEEGDRK